MPLSPALIRDKLLISANASNGTHATIALKSEQEAKGTLMHVQAPPPELSSPELMEGAPDFDKYVRDVAAAASTVSAPVEAMFTISIIFSLTLTPYVLLQALAPAFVTALISSPWVLVLIPYVLIMSAVGLKVSSFFGCKAWWRITSSLVKEN